MRDVLLRLVYWVFRLLRPARRKSDVETILLLQYEMPLGCCVHGTPLYSALKALQPTPKVVVATRGLGVATLKSNPHVDVLIETADPGSSVGSVWKVAQQVRRELRARGLRPDVVLQDASNRRGFLAVLALMLRVAPTAGFAHLGRLYDTPLEYDPGLSLIDNNMRLPTLLGGVGEHVEPEVYFSAEELTKARELVEGGGTVVAFCMQGSGGQRTGWHEERFAAVIRLVEEMGYRTVFVGTAGDAGMIERLRGMAGSKGVSLAGKTSIPELAAVLCLCDLLITLDTGTMHVGRAVDAPMVVLGPSWQKPLEWLPLGKANVRILRGDDREDVPGGYLLDEIEVDAVEQAAAELLRVYPAAEEAREQRVRRRLAS